MVFCDLTAWDAEETLNAVKREKSKLEREKDKTNKDLLKKKRT